jgi:phospholipid/cholesterol/gamma-HCH transport system substrate-binding protein
VEREARYAAVAVFALAAIVAAFAFVWWYSGRADRRVYEPYEIYFEGTVSGLAQGSPVRYLGVDVGRVKRLSVARDDPGRVKVLAEVDAAAPLSGATRARLGLLGLTGLLYIDLQLDSEADPDAALAQGVNHPVIPARKSGIDAFIERLPDLVTRVSEALARIEKLLDEKNIQAVGDSLSDIRAATAELPGLAKDAAALTADLREAATETTALARRLNDLAEKSEPETVAALESGRVAAEKLASAAGSLERIMTANEAALTRAAGQGTAELQQLLIDMRDASAEVRALAQSLRERPSSLLREAPERGVEIEP